MVGVVVTSVVPAEKYGKYMAIISSVMAVSAILGPLLGGAINDHTTWRWVFLLNAPAGAAATAILVFFLPSDFSKANMNVLRRLRSRFTVQSFARVDVLGCLLMLGASILIVFALEEAGGRYAWSSAAIVASLIVAGIGWIAFVGWEMWIERKQKGAGSEGTRQEPIFPMRLLRSRVLGGMLLYTILLFLRNRFADERQKRLLRRFPLHFLGRQHPAALPSRERHFSFASRHLPPTTPPHDAFRIRTLSLPRLEPETSRPAALSRAPWLMSTAYRRWSRLLHLHRRPRWHSEGAVCI